MAGSHTCSFVYHQLKYPEKELFAKKIIEQPTKPEKIEKRCQPKLRTGLNVWLQHSPNLAVNALHVSKCCAYA